MDKQEIKSIITMLKSTDEETQKLGIRLIQTSDWYKNMRPKTVVIIHNTGIWSYYKLNNLSYTVSINGLRYRYNTLISWLESLIQYRNNVMMVRKLKF